MAGRALHVAMIVGPILTIINQGNIIFSGTVMAAVIGKIILTCCVLRMFSDSVTSRTVEVHFGAVGELVQI